MNFKLPKIVTNELLEIAANTSNKNLLKAAEILERFTGGKWHQRGFLAIKKMIQEDHPAIQAARRILQNANPAARSAILNKFILGSILLGYRKRLNYYNKHGIAPLGTLMISPTLRCNLNCYGCYSATHEQREELSFEEVDRVIFEAREAGTNFIIFLGGEPFMVPWLLDMVEKYTSMAFMIYTNGLLIDDKMVERLALLGNAAISIGVDGLREESDERKGPGVYDRATAVMRKLSKAGVVVGFSTMLSRRNFDKIYTDEFLDAMIENGAGYGWIPVVVPQGTACREPDIMLTEDQKKEIRAMIKKVRERKPILLIDFYNDANITEGCGAGRILAHINANGDVEPCVLMPFAADNIREKSIADILRSDFFQGLRDINRRYCKKSQTCMMVHKPKEVLELIHTCGVKATSAGVMDKLNDLVKIQP